MTPEGTPVDAAEGYSSSVLSDALDQHGIDGVITSLEPAHPEHVASGRVRTVRMEEAPDTEESRRFVSGYFDALEAGTVLVVAGASEEISHLGASTARFLADEGLAGAVIDGGFRDLADVRSRSFPVFGAASTPRSGIGRIRASSVDEPVTIDGVTVRTGDVIVADVTGIAVVPGDEADAVLETAREILENDRRMEDDVESGEGRDVFENLPDYR